MLYKEIGWIFFITFFSTCVERFLVFGCHHYFVPANLFQVLKAADSRCFIHTLSAGQTPVGLFWPQNKLCFKGPGHGVPYSRADTYPGNHETSNQITRSVASYQRYSFIDDPASGYIKLAVRWLQMRNDGETPYVIVKQCLMRPHLLLQGSLCVCSISCDLVLFLGGTLSLLPSVCYSVPHSPPQALWALQD